MIRRHFLFYFIVHVLTIVAQMFILKDMFNSCVNTNIPSRFYSSEIFASIYTNLLLMYDISLFCNFYYNKMMYCIIQIYFLKVRFIFVHLILYIHYGFNIWRLIFSVLNLISFMYLIFGTRALVAESYHQYNRRYTCDYTCIMFTILNRSVINLKYLMMLKIISMEFLYLRFGIISPFFIYTSIKLIIYFIDYLIYRNIKNKMLFYKLSTCLFGVFSIFSIIFLVLLHIHEKPYYDVKYIITEVETLMIFCLLLYLLYETKNSISENSN